ncbi:N-acetylmuramidase family protein [Phenylobacterium sp.]|uniref:N-acetylmuramidase family protein n=1 Tax=Phenylobacterium sp. TaxID=1871053 RepID=UPI0030015D9C
MDRTAMFEALRPFAPDRRFTDPMVPLIDAVADAFGLPPAGNGGAVQLELTEKDFADAAARLECSVAQIKAVFEVEASGAGWFTDVRGDILALDGEGGFIDGAHLPKILFEAHIFDRETGGRFRATHPNLSSARWNRALYVGGQGEYERLHRAMQLDRTAALRSASWGAPQIMGFNHALAGFDTVDAFVDAMKSGIRAHLMAFVAFVENSGLAPALRQVTTYHASAVPFARAYNGSGYAKNEYHIRIARAFAKWSRA